MLKLLDDDHLIFSNQFGVGPIDIVTVNIKTGKVDFYALSDVTMSEDMTTYRQNLRDLPSGLSTVEDVNNATYPTKP